MKSLAAVKRAMQKGTRWEAQKYGKRKTLVREIVYRAPNRIGFANPGGVSYIDFPRAEDCKFRDGWVEFWREVEIDGVLQYVPLFRYRQVI